MASTVFPAPGCPNGTQYLTSLVAFDIAPKQEISNKNLLLFSQDFNASAWAKVNITITPIASPTLSSGGSTGANSFVVSSATGIAVGQIVTGTGIISNTFVVSINSTTVVLNNFFNTTGTGTYNFYNADGVNILTTTSNVHTLGQVVTVLSNTNYVLSFYSKKGTDIDTKYAVYNNSTTRSIVEPTSFFSRINLNYSTTASGSVTNRTITVGSSANLYIGLSVTAATGITLGTRIVGISGTTITLDAANTGAVSGSITFTDTNLQRIVVPFTTPTACNSITVYPLWSINNGIGTAIVASVQLEQGTTATYYQITRDVSFAALGLSNIPSISYSFVNKVNSIEIIKGTVDNSRLVTKINNNNQGILKSTTNNINVSKVRANIVARGTIDNRSVSKINNPIAIYKGTVDTRPTTRLDSFDLSRILYNNQVTIGTSAGKSNIAYTINPITTATYSSGGAATASSFVVSTPLSGTISIGYYITGTGISLNTYITNVVSSTTITLSNPLTAQASGTYSFYNSTFTPSVSSKTTSGSDTIITYNSQYATQFTTLGANTQVQQVTVPHSTALTLTTGDFTIEFWFYKSVASFIAGEYIFSKGGIVSTNYPAYGIQSQNGESWTFRIAADTQIATAFGIGIQSIGSSIALNTWNYIAITRSNSAQITTTGATSTGGITTITFATQGSIPFRIGQRVVVVGVTPVGFNGTWTVTNATTSSVSFWNSTAGPQTIAGTVIGSVIITSVNGRMNWNGIQSVVMVDSGRALYIGNQQGGAGTSSGTLDGGYLSNFRIIKGTALYNPFVTVPSSALTSITNTVVLVGQSSSPTVDNSGNGLTVTNTGGGITAGNTTIPFANTYSITGFSGSSYLQVSLGSNTFNPRTASSWTFECWVYLNSYGQTGTFPIFVGTSAGTGRFYAYVSNQSFWIGPGWLTGAQSTTFHCYAATWYHFAFVNDNGFLQVYANGAPIYTYHPLPTTVFPSSYTIDTLVIGYHVDMGFALDGYISNYRYIKNTAVYKSSFTVPTAPLQNVTNTSLLTFQNSTIVDNSSNAAVMTSSVTGSFSPRTFPINSLSGTSLTSSYPGMFIVGDNLAITDQTTTNQTIAQIKSISVAPSSGSVNAGISTVTVASSPLSNLNIANTWTTQAWVTDIQTRTQVDTLYRTIFPMTRNAAYPNINLWIAESAPVNYRKKSVEPLLSYVDYRLIRSGNLNKQFEVVRSTADNRAVSRITKTYIPTAKTQMFNTPLLSTLMKQFEVIRSIINNKPVVAKYTPYVPLRGIDGRNATSKIADVYTTTQVLSVLSTLSRSLPRSRYVFSWMAPGLNSTSVLPKSLSFSSIYPDATSISMNNIDNTALYVTDNLINVGNENPQLINYYHTVSSKTTVGSNLVLAFNDPSSNIPYITTASSYYGTFASASGQYLSAVQAAGTITTGPFTIEAWVYPTSLANTPFIVEDTYWNIGNNSGWYFSINTSGTLRLGYSTATFNVYSTLNSTGTVPTGVWSHVAVVRDSSNNINFYINGALANTPTLLSQSLNLNSGGNQSNWITRIGCHVADSTFLNGFNGNISNVRIVPTKAVYTGNFTPIGPLSRIQSARTNVAALTGTETSLLTLQNSSIIDNSIANGGIGFTIANSGSVLTTLSSAIGPLPTSGSFIAITDTVTNKQALAQIINITISTISISYTLTIPSSSVSNLSVANSWRVVSWSPAVYTRTQAKTYYSDIVRQLTSTPTAYRNLWYIENFPVNTKKTEITLFSKSMDSFSLPRIGKLNSMAVIREAVDTKNYGKLKPIMFSTAPADVRLSITGQNRDSSTKSFSVSNIYLDNNANEGYLWSSSSGSPVTTKTLYFANQGTLRFDVGDTIKIINNNGYSSTATVTGSTFSSVSYSGSDLPVETSGTFVESGATLVSQSYVRPAAKPTNARENLFYFYLGAGIRANRHQSIFANTVSPGINNPTFNVSVLQKPIQVVRGDKIALKTDSLRNISVVRAADFRFNTNNYNNTYSVLPQTYSATTAALSNTNPRYYQQILTFPSKPTTPIDNLFYFYLGAGIKSNRHQSIFANTVSPGADVRFNINTLQKPIEIVRGDRATLSISLLNKSVAIIRGDRVSLKTDPLKHVSVVRGIPNADYKFNVNNITKFFVPKLYTQVFFTPTSSVVNKNVAIIRGDRVFLKTDPLKNISVLRGDRISLRLGNIITVLRGAPKSAYKFDISLLQKPINVVRGDRISLKTDSLRNVSVVRGADFKFNINNITKLLVPKLYTQVFFTPTSSVVNKNVAIVRGDRISLKTDPLKNVSVLRGADFKFNVSLLQRPIQILRGADFKFNINNITKLLVPKLYTQVFFAPTSSVINKNVAIIRGDQVSLKTDPLKNVSVLRGVQSTFTLVKTATTILRGAPKSAYKFDISLLQKPINVVRGDRISLKTDSLRNVSVVRGADFKFNINNITKLLVPKLYTQVFFAPSSAKISTSAEIFRGDRAKLSISLLNKSVAIVRGDKITLRTDPLKNVSIVRGIPNADYKFNVNIYNNTYFVLPQTYSATTAALSITNPAYYQQVVTLPKGTPTNPRENLFYFYQGVGIRDNKYQNFTLGSYEHVIRADTKEKYFPTTLLSKLAPGTAISDFIIPITGQNTDSSIKSFPVSNIYLDNSTNEGYLWTKTTGAAVTTKILYFADQGTLRFSIGDPIRITNTNSNYSSTVIVTGSTFTSVSYSGSDLPVETSGTFVEGGATVFPLSSVRITNRPTNARENLAAWLMAPGLRTDKYQNFGPAYKAGSDNNIFDVDIYNNTYSVLPQTYSATTAALSATDPKYYQQTISFPTNKKPTNATENLFYFYLSPSIRTDRYQNNFIINVDGISGEDYKFDVNSILKLPFSKITDNVFFAPLSYQLSRFDPSVVPADIKIPVTGQTLDSSTEYFSTDEMYLDSGVNAYIWSPTQGPSVTAKTLYFAKQDNFIFEVGSNIRITNANLGYSSTAIVTASTNNSVSYAGTDLPVEVSGTYVETGATVFPSSYVRITNKPTNARENLASWLMAPGLRKDKYQNFGPAYSASSDNNIFDVDIYNNTYSVLPQTYDANIAALSTTNPKYYQQTVVFPVTRPSTPLENLFYFYTGYGLFQKSRLPSLSRETDKNYLVTNLLSRFEPGVVPADIVIPITGQNTDISTKYFSVNEMYLDNGVNAYIWSADSGSAVTTKTLYFANQDTLKFSIGETIRIANINSNYSSTAIVTGVTSNSVSYAGTDLPVETSGTYVETGATLFPSSYVKITNKPTNARENLASWLMAPGLRKDKYQNFGPAYAASGDNNIFDVDALRQTAVVRGIPGSSYKFDVSLLQKQIESIRGTPGEDYKFDVNYLELLKKYTQLSPGVNYDFDVNLIDKMYITKLNTQVFLSPALSLLSIKQTIRGTQSNYNYNVSSFLYRIEFRGDRAAIRAGGLKTVNVVRGTPGADYKFDVATMLLIKKYGQLFPGVDYKFDVNTLLKPIEIIRGPVYGFADGIIRIMKTGDFKAGSVGVTDVTFIRKEPIQFWN